MCSSLVRYQHAGQRHTFVSRMTDGKDEPCFHAGMLSKRRRLWSVVAINFNFSWKKSATKFLCMKTSSGKVVATSFPYPTVHRSIAGDVPTYLKLAFKMTHPFRKRRFPKLSFKSAISLGAFWSCFSPYDTLAIHWHPQEILRRSSQGNPYVGGFKRKGGSDIWRFLTFGMRELRNVAR